MFKLKRIKFIIKIVKNDKILFLHENYNNQINDF